MGTRPGPVKERVAAIYSGYTALLRTFAATAVEQHELPAREDPARIAFELHAILLAADTKFVLHDDPAVLDLARQVVHQRQGLGNGGNAAKFDVVALALRSQAAAVYDLAPASKPAGG